MSLEAYLQEILAITRNLYLILQNGHSFSKVLMANKDLLSLKLKKILVMVKCLAETDSHLL